MITCGAQVGRLVQRVPLRGHDGRSHGGRALAAGEVQVFRDLKRASQAAGSKATAGLCSNERGQEQELFPVVEMRAGGSRGGRSFRRASSSSIEQCREVNRPDNGWRWRAPYRSHGQPQGKPAREGSLLCPGGGNELQESSDADLPQQTPESSTMEGLSERGSTDNEARML